jgi:hypothetical protein
MSESYLPENVESSLSTASTPSSAIKDVRLNVK